MVGGVSILSRGPRRLSFRPGGLGHEGLGGPPPSHGLRSARRNEVTDAFEDVCRDGMSICPSHSTEHEQHVHRPRSSRASPQPPPSLSSLEWLSSKDKCRVDLGFKMLRACTGNLKVQRKMLVDLMQRCHSEGLHMGVLRTFKELCSSGQETGILLPQRDVPPAQKASLYGPILPAELTMALQAGMACKHWVKLERAVVGFGASLPREEGTGRCMTETLGANWWESVAAALPEEDGWKALYPLYLETRKRGLGTGGEEGLRRRVLQSLEAAASMPIRRDEGGDSESDARLVELISSASSSMEELLLQTLSSSSAAPRAWLELERALQGEARGKGRGEGGARKPSPADFDQAITRLARGGMADHANSLLRHLTLWGGVPMASSYAAVATAYARQVRRAGARHVLQEMHGLSEKGCLADTEVAAAEEACAELVRAGRDGAGGEGGRSAPSRREDARGGGQERCEGGERGRREAAGGERLTVAAAGGTPQASSSESRNLRRLARAGRGLEALEALRTMQARGLVPDVWCYNYSLMACARSGLLKEAQGLLEEMPAADRSVYSHSLLIHAAEKAGDWRAAQGVLERMSCRGLVPSVACYGSTMNALGKAGRAEEALALLRRMGTGGEPRPNAVAYTTAIDACARRSLASEALGLLREMEEERGLAPNPVAYACAMNACAKDRRGLEALRLLREMQAKGLAATEAHYGAVLNALNLSEEDDASLLALYAEAQDRRLPQHVSMHGAAIKAGDRMGASDRVISVGRDMLRDGHRPNQRALKLLVYHAYAGGAYQEGVAFFHAREEGYVQNASIIKLVLRCAEKIGDVETVLLCIKEAESKKEWMCRTASRIINREEAEEIRGRQAREGEKREVRRRAVAELKVMLKEWTYEAGKQAQGLEEKVRSKDRRLAVFLRTTRKKGRTGL